MEAQKIKAPHWKMVLAVLGILLFIFVSGLMLFGDSSIFEKVVGALGLVFFGGFGLPVLFSSLIRGAGYLLLNQEGIELHFPDCPVIPLAWQDIEGFGVYEIGGQKLTTIRLYHYDQLLQTIRPAEVKKIIRKFKRMRVMGKATMAIGGPGATALNLLLPSAAELRDLSSLLQASREKYGGEFQIAWNMRDRKAADFAEFLQAQKEARLRNTSADD